MYEKNVHDSIIVNTEKDDRKNHNKKTPFKKIYHRCVSTFDKKNSEWMFY